MKLALRHPSDDQNFDATPKFLVNLWTPAAHTLVTSFPWTSIWQIRPWRSEQVNLAAVEGMSATTAVKVRQYHVQCEWNCQCEDICALSARLVPRTQCSFHLLQRYLHYDVTPTSPLNISQLAAVSSHTYPVTKLENVSRKHENAGICTPSHPANLLYAPPWRSGMPNLCWLAETSVLRLQLFCAFLCSSNSNGSLNRDGSTNNHQNLLRNKFQRGIMYTTRCPQHGLQLVAYKNTIFM
jgi:hypothetical protein